MGHDHAARQHPAAVGAEARQHTGAEGAEAAHEHGHGHGVSPDADRRYLLAAFALISCYLLAEVVVGLLSGSLALLSDAGHMLTDAASLLLALLALHLAARPAHGRWTYGFKRVEILSAQINGITLLGLTAFFAVEAVSRLVSPPRVSGGPVLTTALAGIAVNVAAAWLMSRANRSSLNIEGAYQHILNDLWAFIATAAAGLVVLVTGFYRADALASLVVAALMGRAGYGLVRESWRIFLEAAPAGLEPERVGAALAAVPGVVEVHDLHIWTITSGYPALSAHVLVSPDRDCHALRLRLEHTLHDELHVDHTTLQVDHAAPELLALGRAPGGPAPSAAHCADPHGTAHRAP